MVEILGFNSLFSEAKLRRVSLNSFHQMPNGKFRANWRADDQFGEVAERDLPFEAARDSFLSFIYTMKRTTIAEPAPEVDLFA